MLRTKLLWALALVGLVSCGRGHPGFPVYSANRSIVPRGFKAKALAHFHVGASDDGTLRQAFTDIVPERSLFVNDCGAFNKFPRRFTFLSRMALAGRMSNPEMDLAAWETWVNDNVGPATGFNNPLFTVDPAEFQLAAIVNRLDLGEHTDSGWEKVELRFIYAAADPKKTEPKEEKKIRLILEFVLKPLDDQQFRDLAKSWRDLSKGSNFSQRLGSLIERIDAGDFGAYKTARLRTNSNLDSAGWKFAQWNLESGGIKAGPLDSQIYPDCVNESKASDNKGGCESYAKFWDSYDLGELRDRLKVPSNLSPTAPQSYVAPRPDNDGVFVGMQIPDGVTKPDCRIRDVIAIQQCTFCHGAETGTEFRHVRDKGNSGFELSAFLKGKVSKPDLNLLANADESVVSKVSIDFSVPKSVTGCSGLQSGSKPNMLRETRSYHDLGRRAIFLAAAALEPQAGASAKDVKALEADRAKLIQDYSAKLSH